MPIKLRPSGKRWIKDPKTGRSTNRWEPEHYYIKGISQTELFEELNNPVLLITFQQELEKY